MKQRKIDPNRIYNVEEAAKVLDVNPQTLLDYLRDGKIAAQKIGEWKIYGQNLIDYLSLKEIEILPHSYRLANGNWIPRANVVKHYGSHSRVISYVWYNQPVDDEERANFLAKSWVNMLLTIKGERSPKPNVDNFNDMPIADSINAKGDEAMKKFIVNVKNIVKQALEIGFIKPEIPNVKRTPKETREILLEGLSIVGSKSRATLLEFLKPAKKNTA